MNYALTTELAYSKGFKYQVREHPQSFNLAELGGVPDLNWKWLHIKDNVLTIDLWYAWDGCSGPTLDGPKSHRASLLHDALYQLIRQGLLDSKHKAAIDLMFYNQLIEDGFWKFRADYYLWAVTKFGEGSTLASHRQKVHYAP